MFTGIIEHIGSIKAIEIRKNLLVFTIDAGPLVVKIKKGHSVAINGVCLTAVKKSGRTVDFELMRETIEKTSLQALGPGDKVNLELALRHGDRLGGHFVTGHVDEVGVVQSITREKNWAALRVGVSKTNHKYFAAKGSVALDGISLTVGRVGKNYFDVYLIPYTLKITTLGLKKSGDVVNIETDILAKYLFNKSR